MINIVPLVPSDKLHFPAPTVPVPTAAAALSPAPAATIQQPKPVVPAGAVVVPGSRPISSGPGKDAGIQLYTPVIVKYRDGRTDASVALEDALR